jgi:RNA polymerase sigma factor (sigma-70 family)
VASDPRFSERPGGGERLLTDHEIVELSRADPEAFGQIFDRHFDPIHRHLARRVGESLADDLAAQVFTVAFERRARFNAEAADIRPWLYGIATNLLRNHRRAERRLLAKVAKAAHELGAPDADALAGADAVEHPRLARALKTLSLDQRDALLLHVWEQMSYTEIAAALGVPPGTVASRISRACQRLRAVLGDETEADAVVHRARVRKEQT